MAFVVPQLENEERLRLDVLGKLVDQIFQRLHQRLAPHPLVLLRLRVIVRPRGDIKLLLPRGLVLPFHRFLHEIRRALRVVDIRHRHSPESHRAIAIQRRRLPERSLRFKVPKPVNLPEPLVEKLLRQLVLRRHREMHLSGPCHQHGCLARPFIESLAHQRVAGKRLLVSFCGRRLGGVHRERERQ